MPTLAVIDTGGAQQLGRGSILDHFGDGLDAEFGAQSRDGFDERTAKFGARGLADKAAVDLDAIDLYAAQVIESGGADTKIIEADVNTHFAKLLQGFVGALQISNLG